MSDLKARLEDKGIVARHRQAQRYLKRAEEARQVIQVQVAVRLNAYRVTDFLSPRYLSSVFLSYQKLSSSSSLCHFQVRVDHEIAPASCVVSVNPNTCN